MKDYVAVDNINGSFLARIERGISMTDNIVFTGIFWLQTRYKIIWTSAESGS